MFLSVGNFLRSARRSFIAVDSVLRFFVFRTCVCVCVCVCMERLLNECSREKTKWIDVEEK
jgi:hypothetical protein